MSAEARLDAIAAAVAEARRAVAGGALVEVSGLDAAVAEMCEAARALPADERGAFAGRLVELAEALDGLATELQRQKETAQRQRANDAYGREGTR